VNVHLGIATGTPATNRFICQSHAIAIAKRDVGRSAPMSNVMMLSHLGRAATRKSQPRRQLVGKDRAHWFARAMCAEILPPEDCIDL